MIAFIINEKNEILKFDNDDDLSDFLKQQKKGSRLTIHYCTYKVECVF